MSNELSFACLDAEGRPGKLVLTVEDGHVSFAIVSGSGGDGARHWARASTQEMRRMATGVLSVLGQHAADGDRRFELACFALSGLAPEFHKSGADENADEIAKRAVELADATVSALRTTPK